VKLKVDKLEGVFETPAVLAEQFNSDSAVWCGTYQFPVPPCWINSYYSPDGEF